MMMLVELRTKIPNDIFTTLELTELLAEYSNPKVKISSMISSGEIIQIRRGLYTFPETLRREPLSIGTLANRIHGPSYVSEDFALSYYGLIPETPALVTSIALGRSREFSNDFGVFSYRYCRSQAYHIGITTTGEGQNRFLVATPEKALFDKILFDKRFDGTDIESYLYEDLRLDEELLQNFNKENIAELAPFMCGRLRSLLKYLEAL